MSKASSATQQIHCTPPARRARSITCRASCCPGAARTSGTERRCLSHYAFRQRRASHPKDRAYVSHIGCAKRLLLRSAPGVVAYLFNRCPHTAALLQLPALLQRLCLEARWRVPHPAWCVHDDACAGWGSDSAMHGSSYASFPGSIPQKLTDALRAGERPARAAARQRGCSRA